MTLSVQVVSPERTVWSGEATMVVARTVDGEIGVLSGHAPTLAILAGGEIRVSGEGGDGLTTQVDGGFLSVEHDTVLIVAERVGEQAGDGSDRGPGQRQGGTGEGSGAPH